MLKVTEDFLRKAQESRAKDVVTEVMKTLDKHDDKELVKGLIKEYIYAGFREIVTAVKIFNEGLVIEFKDRADRG